MYTSIFENNVYYLLDIYPFLKVIHKHDCNEISFDLYNHVFFMKTGCEIKMIEIQSDVDNTINKIY